MSPWSFVFAALLMLTIIGLSIAFSPPSLPHKGNTESADWIDEMSFAMRNAKNSVTAEAKTICVDYGYCLGGQQGDWGDVMKKFGEIKKEEDSINMWLKYSSTTKNSRSKQ